MSAVAVRRELADGTTVLQLSTSTAHALEKAIAERDAGFAAAEAADRTEWDRRLIDQAIDALAETDQPFSANDLRDLVGDVRPALLGARFQHAANNRGVIRFTGYVKSTKPNTHAKPVGLWRGTTGRTEA